MQIGLRALEEIENEFKYVSTNGHCSAEWKFSSRDDQLDSRVRYSFLLFETGVMWGSSVTFVSIPCTCGFVLQTIGN